MSCDVEEAISKRRMTSIIKMQSSSTLINPKKRKMIIMTEEENDMMMMIMKQLIQMIWWWWSNSYGQTELTWNMDTASKSNGLVSGDAIFPLRSFHLTSISLTGSKHLSICFVFTTSKRDSGSLSATLTRRLSNVECILVQSLQQSQSPSGNSCHWFHTYYVQWAKSEEWSWCPN